MWKSKEKLENESYVQSPGANPVEQLNNPVQEKLTLGFVTK